MFGDSGLRWQDRALVPLVVLGYLVDLPFSAAMDTFTLSYTVPTTIKRILGRPNDETSSDSAAQGPETPGADSQAIRSRDDAGPGGLPLRGK
jgi:hypothetical protein